MMYNVNKIKQAITPEEVAQRLGIPTKWQCGRQYIICPIHKEELGREDTTFGNAVLTDDGFFCFACNKGGDIFNMIMAVKKVSFREALEIAAEWTSCSLEEVQTNDFDFKDYVFLSGEEMRLLGLTSIRRDYNIVGCDITPPDSYLNTIPKKDLYRFNVEQGSFLIVDRGEQYYSFGGLMKEDFEMFKTIILGKAKEAINKRKEMIKMFEVFHDEETIEIINCYQKEITEIIKILRKIKIPQELKSA